MIDAIQLWTAAESTLAATQFATLSLNQADPTESYILRQALGLDVDGVVPQVYGGYSNPNGVGDIFRNMALKPREIALRIKLNPQWASSETPSSLRAQLYRMIAYSRSGMVELRFMLGGVSQAYIQGFITKLESSLFSDETEVSITILCPYPFIQGSTLVSITEGWVSPDLTITDSISTAPHGFMMKFTIVDQYDTPFRIYTRYGGSSSNDLSAPFIIDKQFRANDVIYFSSVSNNKYLYFDRGATRKHITDKIRKNSIWPTMFPGTTKLYFRFAGADVDPGDAWNPDDITIDYINYRHHFWGI